MPRLRRLSGDQVVRILTKFGFRVHSQRGSHIINLPGYYYLHREIPFYDANTGRLIFAAQEKTELEAIVTSVSHIVSADPAASVPGYSVEKIFGTIRILRRDADEPAIRTWQEYVPTIAGGSFAKVMRKIYPDAPTPPPNSGIRFTDIK